MPTILFETEYFRLKKKQVLARFEPRTFAYHLQAKFAGDTKKLEFIMNQGTNRSPDDSCDQVIYGKKSLVPDCKILAFRKGNNL